MDDLISRQAAIDAIKEFYRGAKEWKDEQEERSDIWHRADSAIASALEIGLRIKKIPSVQPERKKGKWEEIYDANENGEPYPCGAACSECGFPTNVETDFCPYCGADMRCGDTE